MITKSYCRTTKKRVYGLESWPTIKVAIIYSLCETDLEERQEGRMCLKVNKCPFPTEFLSGATTCNGTNKPNITAVMTNTWLNSDHKVTQTEHTHTCEHA